MFIWDWLKRAEKTVEDKIHGNQGVIERDPDELDYRAGGETGIVYEERNPSGDWSNFLPSDEVQFQNGFDTSGCVSFSALNAIETQINFMYSGLSKAHRDWLDSGGRNFSDRFLAKISGTTAQGNYQTTVLEALRKNGVPFEKDYPFAANSFNEFYQEIPQSVKDKAKEFLTYFDVKYEWIGYGGLVSADELKKALKQAPVQVTVPVCRPWSNSVPVCGIKQPQHAVIVYLVDQLDKIFDQYAPFRKELQAGYFLYSAIKLVLTPKEVKPSAQPVVTFEVDISMGQSGPEVLKLQQVLKRFGFFTVNPTGYYGEWTRRAVEAFQTAYAVASPSELLAIHGKNVGPKTRAKLNQLLSK